jgi:hypothetical protein
MCSGEYGISVDPKHPGGFIAREYVRVDQVPVQPASVQGEVQGVVYEEDATRCLVSLPWHESFGQKFAIVAKESVSPR